MAHLFTNRHRKYNRLSRRLLGKTHFGWESANAILYLIGGLIFIVGSVFFLPRYESLFSWGAWLFFWGSLIYAIVTVHDWLESHNHWRSHKRKLWNRLEFLSANVYVVGTFLFAIGSLLFLPGLDLTAAGGWCFIIGSLLFFVGACINVMGIINVRSNLMLQLSNATAIAFILGSFLFLVASIPYLWQGEIQRELLTYLAWQYIAGSAFFFVGGIFNFYRASRAQRHYRKAENQNRR